MKSHRNHGNNSVRIAALDVSYYVVGGIFTNLIYYVIKNDLIIYVIMWRDALFETAKWFLMQDVAKQSFD